MLIGLTDLVNETRVLRRRAANSDGEWLSLLPSQMNELTSVGGEVTRHHPRRYALPARSDGEPTTMVRRNDRAYLMANREMASTWRGVSVSDNGR